MIATPHTALYVPTLTQQIEEAVGTVDAYEIKFAVNDVAFALANRWIGRRRMLVRGGLQPPPDTQNRLFSQLLRPAASPVSAIIPKPNTPFPFRGARMCVIERFVQYPQGAQLIVQYSPPEMPPMGDARRRTVTVQVEGEPPFDYVYMGISFWLVSPNQGTQ